MASFTSLNPFTSVEDGGICVNPEFFREIPDVPKNVVEEAVAASFAPASNALRGDPTENVSSGLFGTERKYFSAILGLKKRTESYLPESNIGRDTGHNNLDRLPTEQSGGTMGAHGGQPLWGRDALQPTALRGGAQGQAGRPYSSLGQQAGAYGGLGQQAGAYGGLGQQAGAYGGLGQQANPYMGQRPYGGASTNPYMVQRPYWTSQYGSASSNPYGGASSNPYGGASSNPYGGASSNPYGGASSNPYGGASSNPYGGASSNPYGGASSNPYGSASSNPYVGASQYGGLGRQQMRQDNNPFGFLRDIRLPLDALQQLNMSERPVPLSTFIMRDGEFKEQLEADYAHTYARYRNELPAEDVRAFGGSEYPLKYGGAYADNTVRMQQANAYQLIQVAHMREKYKSAIKENDKTLGRITPPSVDELSITQLIEYLSRQHSDLMSGMNTFCCNAAITGAGGLLSGALSGKTGIAMMDQYMNFQTLSAHLEDMKSEPWWNYSLRRLTKDMTLGENPWVPFALMIGSALFSSQQDGMTKYKSRPAVRVEEVKPADMAKGMAGQVDDESAAQTGAAQSGTSGTSGAAQSSASQAGASGAAQSGTSQPGPAQSGPSHSGATQPTGPALLRAGGSRALVAKPSRRLTERANSPPPGNNSKNLKTQLRLGDLPKSTGEIA